MSSEKKRNPEEIIVHSWDELNSILFNENESPLGNPNYKNIYRGISCCDFSLSTSIMRMAGNSASIEDALLGDFEKYSNLKFGGHSTDWTILATAQHYGLPTRLLDWTFSPFVALHFCTFDPSQYHLDGAIWSINIEEANKLLPQALKDVLTSTKTNSFTVNSLCRISSSLGEFKEKYSKEQDFILFFEPPSLDQRIVNQFALFSMASKVDLFIEDWLRVHENVGKKIVIPFKLKWEIRDKLDHLNITERVLFPGFDGLSNWIKRKNSPKGINDDFIATILAIDKFFKKYSNKDKVENGEYIALIDLAIGYGAPAYNNGQYDKCKSTYKYVGNLLIQHRLKLGRPLADELEQLQNTLNQESDIEKNIFIWNIRRCFDKIKTRLKD